MKWTDRMPQFRKFNIYMILGQRFYVLARCVRNRHVFRSGVLRANVKRNTALTAIYVRLFKEPTDHGKESDLFNWTELRHIK